MEHFIFFPLTIAIAAVGGLFAKKYHLPGGYLIGAIITTALFMVITNKGIFYPRVRTGLQVFSGMLIGSRMGKDVLHNIKKLWPSIIVMTVMMLFMNVVFGMMNYAFGDLDPATALFAVTPGGVNDISIIAADFGANTAYVAVLHVARILLVYSLIPPLVRFVHKKNATASGKGRRAELIASEVVCTDPKDFWWMLLLSVCGGCIFYLIGVTAGALIGSMLASGCFCVMRGRQKYPPQLKKILQIGSGAYIGVKFTRSLCANLGNLLIPLLISFLCVIFFTLVIGFSISKFSNMDICTAMLAASPGGLSEMSLLADELDADTVSVAVLHVFRLFIVLTTFPYLLGLLIRFTMT